MKVGDKVQYCGYDTLGATGEIIREKEKTLYYSKWEREGDDRYCMCYLVRYTMPNDKIVDNVARPEDLKLLENEEDTSKWYNCAHCDAGYPDQECTCEENEK